MADYQKVLTSGLGNYPEFTLSHNSCQHIRRAPVVILRVLHSDGTLIRTFNFPDITNAVRFWNDNKNNII